jgi:hypothetical protein
VADSGTALNALRAKIIKAVLFDDDLALLAGSGGARSLGNVRYIGLSPTVFEGRLIVGRMNLRFRISYPFNPKSL